MSVELRLPRTIKLGTGSLQELGGVAKELQSSHLFIMTGTLATKEPFKSQIETSIRAHGLQTTYYTHCNGEPSTEHLMKALSLIESCGADCVVAIGGGSVLDLAKAVSVFAVNHHLSLDDIGEMENVSRLPLICIPTTAGTGSEATKVMVITDNQSKIKKNPAHSILIPDVAILDPCLTESLPSKITAYTGLDALAHALEAFVSTKATVMSDYFALEAIKIIRESLPKVYANNHDLEARQKMLLGSCYAGIAFTNASTNLAHAMARPLGARFSIPHGLSVSLLMPFVIEFGLEAAEEKYAQIAYALGINRNWSNLELAKEVILYIRHFNQSFQIWQDGLTYLECQKEQFEKILPLMIRDALSGNGIITNPIIPTEDDIEKIYRDLYQELTKWSVRVDNQQI